MPLFQNSVLKKYLAGQDYAAMHAAFGAYLTYFHDPMRRANIRASKEEQFGERFHIKVKLSLSEEAEWMAYFHEKKAKAQSLQSDITRLDREIDALV
ncbi:hypothetical protein M3O96_20895 [Aquiflexum sp. TKW24L]|uniref:hypothetical protein n=1 Tax=Aquiflexum sp. TKW24L TaxID=2942212 RepID=UPI0020BD6169|nr:hypothetical protein [Aquiflexum sp. TKW24L]MCL6261571.1 hypothetical protein [Aquiflexum sp. TKW24L]